MPPDFRTLVLMDLSSLFQQLCDQETVALNKIQKHIETLGKDLSKKIKIPYNICDFIKLSFLIPEEDLKNNKLTIGPRYTPCSSELDSVLKIINDSHNFFWITNYKSISVSDLIPYKKSAEGHPIINEDLIKNNREKFGEKIIFISNDDNFKNTEKNTISNNIITIKIHGPAEFDADDINALRIKLEHLKQNNQLNSFSKAILYLDIDDTALLVELALKNNNTLINPNVLEMKNLLEEYFPQGIEYKVLTARPKPHKPNIKALIEDRPQMETIDETIKHIVKNAKEELELKYNSQQISESEKLEGIKMLNQILENPLHIWRVIITLEFLLKTKINTDDIYFTNNKHYKYEVIKQESKEGKLPYFVIYADDNSGEFIKAQELAKEFIETKSNTVLSVIRAWRPGDLRDDATREILDCIAKQHPEKMRTDKREEAPKDSIFFTKKIKLEAPKNSIPFTNTISK